MTAVEVRDTAFTRMVEIDKIKEDTILAVQQKHLIPVLGEDFYDAIVADPIKYAEVIAKIKPALAYIVKYYLLPDIFSEVSTTGIGLITGKNNQKASRDELGDHQKSAIDTYEMHIGVLTKYLNDNTSSYPLYHRSANPNNQIIHAGGIVFGEHEQDDDDDYWLRRQQRY